MNVKPPEYNKEELREAVGFLRSMDIETYPEFVVIRLSVMKSDATAVLKRTCHPQTTGELIDMCKDVFRGKLPPEVTVVTLDDHLEEDSHVWTARRDKNGKERQSMEWPGDETFGHAEEGDAGGYDVDSDLEPIVWGELAEGDMTKMDADVVTGAKGAFGRLGKALDT